MKCEYCGRVLRAGEYECAGCGAQVENPEVAVTEEVRTGQYISPTHDKFEKLDRYQEQIKYGGFFVRVLATWLDWIICAIICVGIMVIGDFDFEFSLFYLVWGMFDVICQLYFEGATPGKKGMRIKVVNKSYSKISLTQAIIRAVSKILLWPIVIGYLMVLFSTKKRSLHDCIAGTCVIRD